MVVSGMAEGIDAAAMKGALRAGGFVAAILGGGVDVIYPYANRRLYEDVAATGVLLSEYPPGTPAEAWHFPVRNRIISGLSDGVLLIEAQEKSGTHSTINYALNQGREVFALPGNVDAPGSELPLKLLKEGAQICTCGADILAHMEWEGIKAAQESFLPDDTEESDPVLRALAMEEKTLEELLTETGMPVEELKLAPQPILPPHLMSFT
jgi:DNA processing protein